MSDPTGRIAHMFDTGFRASSDTGLIETISELAAAEAAAAARRLAAIAELVRRRCNRMDRAADERALPIAPTASPVSGRTTMRW